MGKVTVFTQDGCPHCRRAKELLRARGAGYREVSLTAEPEWRSLLYILSGGRTSVPQVFFNGCHIGGREEVEGMEEDGTLAGRLRECEEEEEIDFPPPLRRPESQEFLQVIPTELRTKWHIDLEAMDSRLGGTAQHPISSLLLMLETPEEMVVVCTAGPGREVYSVGAGGRKGQEGSEEKLYCQVAIEKKSTLFITDPLKVPGLESNEDWVKFGYGYYLGAPWVVGQTRGTIVAMEKNPDILKPEHVAIIEAARDEVERDLAAHRQQAAQS